MQQQHEHDDGDRDDDPDDDGDHGETVIHWLALWAATSTRSRPVRGYVYSEQFWGCCFELFTVSSMEAAYHTSGVAGRMTHSSNQFTGHSITVEATSIPSSFGAWDHPVWMAPAPRTMRLMSGAVKLGPRFARLR